MTRHRTHRTDGNHAAVREAARQRGWYFADCSQTELGFDALLVKAGRIVVVEIKDGSRPLSAQRLTPHEQDVHAALKAHGVHVEIVTCVEDLEILEREHSRASNRIRGQRWGSE